MRPVVEFHTAPAVLCFRLLVEVLLQLHRRTQGAAGLFSHGACPQIHQNNVMALHKLVGRQHR